MKNTKQLEAVAPVEDAKKAMPVAAAKPVALDAHDLKHWTKVYGNYQALAKQKNRVDQMQQQATTQFIGADASRVNFLQFMAEKYGLVEGAEITPDGKIILSQG